MLGKHDFPAHLALAVGFSARFLHSFCLRFRLPGGILSESGSNDRQRSSYVAVSSKKKAPAAKPVARRFKVAVPERLTIAFDTNAGAIGSTRRPTRPVARLGKSEHELVAVPALP
jgi:hypothetical protein